jgi:7-cyano-7-deazaguanine synthase
MVHHVVVEFRSPGPAVLLSGGIDSAVVLALLVGGSRDTVAIWVDYGQRAAASERDASRAIASCYGVAWAELGVANLAPPPVGEFPGRNDLLVAVAAAASPGRSIAIGVHAGTGYADCSPSWAQAWQELLTAQYHGAVCLLAPLASLTKAQVYALAQQLGVPTALAHSCETAAVPCDACSSCADRRVLDVRP